MSQETCMYWDKGHKYMQCKYCNIPNREYCKVKFGGSDISEENNCPRCGDVFERSGLSRMDNKTSICNKCGNWEAMIDFRFLRNTDTVEQINDVLNILEMLKYTQNITNIHEFKYFGRIKTILNAKLKKLNKSN